MSDEEIQNDMEFDIASGDADLLYDLFCKVGVLSSGGEEHFHADFPTDGDETATYRNAVFCIRRFDWSDRDDGFDPVRDVNFEHFPSGLKLCFYKHVGRSTYANRQLADGEMRHIVDECAASLGEGHKKGLPRPAVVGVVQDVAERRTSKGALQRTVRIDGVEYLCFDPTIRTPKVGEEIAIRRLKLWKGKQVVAFIEDPCDLAEAKALHAGPPRTFTRAPELDEAGRDGSAEVKAWRDDTTGKVIRCWPNLDPNRMD